MDRAITWVWAGLLMGGLSVANGAYAQTFNLLYAFQGGSDGAYPSAGLVEDSQGNFYGTTKFGDIATAGKNADCESPLGCGTLFELTSTGTESVIHGFARKDRGQIPESDLFMNGKGNLFGTTLEGGSGKHCLTDHQGCGIIFEISPDGKEKILHSFQGGEDGADSDSGLFPDGAGNFYGMTGNGGTGGCKPEKGCGTVFKLASDGKVTVLYSFRGGNDGKFPTGDLVEDSAGNLYGATEEGGEGLCSRHAGCGTIFKLAPDGTETILYRFKGPQDGAYPFGGLLLDSSGSLYGVTAAGGNTSSCAIGCGTVFKISSDGTETQLYRFCSQAGCADGADGVAGVVSDAAGNLYGVTAQGGTTNGACSFGCGVVYELTTGGSEIVLHAFDSSDGAQPYGGLMIDKSGTLYGTTEIGGANQDGVIFSITN